jgi:hypothetical protein
MSATDALNAKPRKQLSDQLDRLDTIIDALGEALPEAVADAAREGTRAAVREAILEILANPDLRTAVLAAAPVDPMAKPVTIEEFHLTIRVPADLPATAAAAVRRTLADEAFRTRLRRAIRRAVRSFPDLDVVRLSLTR